MATSSRHTQYEDHPFQPAPVAGTSAPPSRHAESGHHRGWKFGDADRRRNPPGQYYHSDRRAH